MLMVFFRALVVAERPARRRPRRVTDEPGLADLPERLGRRLLRRHRCCWRSPCSWPARCPGGCRCCSCCSSALLPFVHPARPGRQRRPGDGAGGRLHRHRDGRGHRASSQRRPLSAASPRPDSMGGMTSRPAAAQAHGPRLALRHGRRARPRGGADPRRRGLRRAAHRDRPAVPAADEQLDLHPARPEGPAAPVRDRRTGGRDLDQRPGHRAVPRRPAARGDGVRHRRGRADHRACTRSATC